MKHPPAEAKMTKRALAAMVSVVVVLCGCAADRHHKPRDHEASQRCTGSQCNIDVVVSGTAPHVVVAVPDTVEVDRNSRPAMLKWHLRSSDPSKYEFRRDSIQFTEEASGQQFTPEGPQGGNKEYIVKDANTDDRKYRYLVKIYVRGTNDWYPSDPFIWNGR
jgi:hypothetical protein